MSGSLAKEVCFGAFGGGWCVDLHLISRCGDSFPWKGKPEVVTVMQSERERLCLGLTSSAACGRHLLLRGEGED